MLIHTWIWLLADAEELHEGKTIANYGRVIVRGNNVLFKTRKWTLVGSEFYDK